MSDITITTQQVDALVLDKKLESYGKNNNFVAPRELTVTITLDEYRDLVSSHAKSSAEIDELRSEKWKLAEENKKLKDTLSALKSLCPATNENKEDKDDVD